jgi:hypothetical protein
MAPRHASQTTFARPFNQGPLTPITAQLTPSQYCMTLLSLL